MPDWPAGGTWKPFLTTPDVEATLARVAVAGGQVVAPAMAVDRLGVQAWPPTRHRRVPLLDVPFPGVGRRPRRDQAARAWRAPGASARSISWEVADLDDALHRVKKLGGTVEHGPDDTPWGRLAAATDPAGAAFKLRTSPAPVSVA